MPRRSRKYASATPPSQPPPVSSKAREYGKNAASGRELQSELDELRNRGIAKLLNRHFTDTTAQVAREKAQADAALRDLARRRAQTKKYDVAAIGAAPTAELSQMDAMYRDIQQKRAECRRKERETILLYQRYVHKFGATGKVAAPDFQGGLQVSSPATTSPTKSTNTNTNTVTPPREPANAQGNNDASSLSNGSEGDEILQQQDDLNFRNFYRRQLSDRDVGFLSPASKSTVLEPTQEEDEESDDEEEQQPEQVSAAPAAKEEKQETPALEQTETKDSDDSAPAKNPESCKKQLAFKESQISSLSRSDDDIQDDEQVKAVPEPEPEPEQPKLKEKTGVTDPEETKHTEAAKENEPQSSNRSIPEKTPERPEAEDDSVDRPTKPSAPKTKSVSISSTPEITRNEKDNTENASASEAGTDISDGKPREVSTEVPGVASTENDDEGDSDDSDLRSIISGLTSINSGVTRQVLDEVETQLEMFIQTETEHIRKMMDMELDDDDDKSTNSSGDFSNSGSSSMLDNDSRRATLRAEDMARQMQQILDEFGNDEVSVAGAATVVTDDGSEVVAPRAREGYPKKYKGGPPDEQWIVHYDETYEREYYFEIKTKRTQWDPPFVATAIDDVSLMSASGHSRSGHQSLFTHQDMQPNSVRTRSRRDVYRRRRRKRRLRRIAAAGMMLLIILCTALYWRQYHPDITFRQGIKSFLKQVQSFDFAAAKQEWQDKIDYAISDRREREAEAERQRELVRKEQERVRTLNRLTVLQNYAAQRVRQDTAQRGVSAGVLLMRVYQDQMEEDLRKQREQEELERQREELERERMRALEIKAKEEGMELAIVAQNDELDRTCKGLRRFVSSKCRQRKRETKSFTNADLVNVIALIE